MDQTLTLTLILAVSRQSVKSLVSPSASRIAFRLPGWHHLRTSTVCTGVYQWSDAARAVHPRKSPHVSVSPENKGRLLRNTMCGASRIRGLGFTPFTRKFSRTSNADLPCANGLW